MNKTQKLNLQAQEVLKELGATNAYHVEIFYGDCNCEYIERNTLGVGWHLEIDGATYDQGTAARYLGQSYDIATKRLPQALKGIVRAWERELAQS